MFIHKRYGLTRILYFPKRISVSQPSRRNFSFDTAVLINDLTETLQSIHSASNLPWWAVIPLTTFAFRTVWTLPFSIAQRKRTQKQNELKPIISAMLPVFKQNLAERVNQARAVAASSKDYVPTPMTEMGYEHIMLLSTKETRKRQKKLFKDNNCQIWKGFLLPVFQIPLWVAMSFTFRNLSGWSNLGLGNKVLDPSLINEGMLWFPDLSVADPTGVLPVVLGFVALSNIEWNVKTLELNRMGEGKKHTRPTAFDALTNASRLSIVFLMAIATQAPSALSLYWISSNIYSLAQNVLLDIFLPIGYTPYQRFDFKKASPKALPLVKE